MSEESLLGSERPVPVATIGGAQIGRESPKQRKQRMLAEMAKGSQQDVPAEVLDFEKAHGVQVPVRSSPVKRQEAQEPESSSRKRKYHPVVKLTREKFVVSMEISGVGTYRTPAYNVVDAGYGLFVVLPKGDSDTIFIPGVGTQVSISAHRPAEISYKCFYPGIMAEIPGLDAVVLAFVKVDEPSKETA
jgi:hypothetical protein